MWSHLTFFTVEHTFHLFFSFSFFFCPYVEGTPLEDLPSPSVGCGFKILNSVDPYGLKGVCFQTLKGVKLKIVSSVLFKLNSQPVCRRRPYAWGLEMVRAIAVARLVMPKTVVRLSAGRVNMVRNDATV